MVIRCCASIPQDFYILALATSFVFECEVVDDCSVPLSSSLRILLLSLSRCGCVQVYSRALSYSVADFEFEFRFLHILVGLLVKVTTITRQGVHVGVLATAAELGWRSE